ncbi:MAG TPA: YraN family protein [Bacillota bacterium]
MAIAAPDRRRRLGRWGEAAAAEFLRAQGLVVLASGYRCPRGEVDLVCREGRWLVFVEVKTRLSQAAGAPEEAVTVAKQRRVAAAAHHFLLQHRLYGVPYRFDVVAVDVGLVEGMPALPRIRHHRNAFTPPA